MNSAQNCVMLIQVIKDFIIVSQHVNLNEQDSFSFDFYAPVTRQENQLSREENKDQKFK